MCNWEGKRYNSFVGYYRRKYGERLQKLVLDAGFSCPNRDGTVGRGGCTYCDNAAFHPGYSTPGKPLLTQLDEGIEFQKIRYPRARHYLAYFQAYSNTYAPLERLKSLYEEVLSHPEVVGIVIGTRPDCVDEEKLDYLADLAGGRVLDGWSRILGGGKSSDGQSPRQAQSIQRGQALRQAQEPVGGVSGSPIPAAVVRQAHQPAAPVAVVRQAHQPVAPVAVVRQAHQPVAELVEAPESSGTPETPETSEAATSPLLLTAPIVVVEYGIESCDDVTLRRINRGHDFQCARKAVEMTASRGIDTCAHFILGLPGETRQMLLDQCEAISSLPLRSVKFHQLQIVKGTPMEKEYSADPSVFYRPSLDEYLDFVIDLLERLRPDLYIERVAGEVPPRFVNDTPWGLVRNFEILRLLDKRLEERNTWQGRLYR